MKVLPSTARVLEQPPLLGGEPVEPGGDQRVQRLRHLERLDRSRQPVDGPSWTSPAVEEHADRLDRVQRDALGAVEDPVAERVREPRHEPVRSSSIASGDSGSR